MDIHERAQYLALHGIPAEQDKANEHIRECHICTTGLDAKGQDFSEMTDEVTGYPSDQVDPFLEAKLDAVRYGFHVD